MSAAAGKVQPSSRCALALESVAGVLLAFTIPVRIVEVDAGRHRFARKDRRQPGQAKQRLHRREHHFHQRWRQPELGDEAAAVLLPELK